MIYILILIAVVFAYLFFDLFLNPERYINIYSKVKNKFSKKKDEN